MRNIILTGPVGSGKTTTLQHWVAGRHNIAGILSPVIEGKRFFQDIAGGQIFPMETNADRDALPVGRFVFSRSAFERAASILESAPAKHPAWIVIDEIGPLELSGKGFGPVLKAILSDQVSAFNLILVVREQLAEHVLSYFRLEPGSVEIKRMDDPFFSE